MGCGVQGWESGCRGDVRVGIGMGGADAGVGIEMWWVGGIPLIELIKTRVTTSYVERYRSHIQDVQELMRRISRIVRHASFPKLSMFEILSFPKTIC